MGEVGAVAEQGGRVIKTAEGIPDADGHAQQGVVVRPAERDAAAHAVRRGVRPGVVEGKAHAPGGHGKELRLPGVAFPALDGIGGDFGEIDFSHAQGGLRAGAAYGVGAQGIARPQKVQHRAARGLADGQRLEAGSGHGQRRAALGHGGDGGG